MVFAHAARAARSNRSVSYRSPILGKIFAQGAQTLAPRALGAAQQTPQRRANKQKKRGERGRSTRILCENPAKCLFDVRTVSNELSDPFKRRERLCCSRPSELLGWSTPRKIRCKYQRQQLVDRFGKAHGTSKISCLAFDASERRLLTGANDGTVKMWNFNNGKVRGVGG